MFSLCASLCLCNESEMAANFLNQTDRARRLVREFSVKRRSRKGGAHHLRTGAQDALARPPRELSGNKVNVHRLRRADESVLDVRAIQVDTNNDTARIYPRCIRENGSGWVERREHAIAQQKGVCNV